MNTHEELRVRVMWLERQVAECHIAIRMLMGELEDREVRSYEESEVLAEIATLNADAKRLAPELFGDQGQAQHKGPFRSA